MPGRPDRVLIGTNMKDAAARRDIPPVCNPIRTTFSPSMLPASEAAGELSLRVQNRFHPQNQPAY
jgi:hypothetical protein